MPDSRLFREVTVASVALPLGQGYRMEDPTVAVLRTAARRTAERTMTAEDRTGVPLFSPITSDRMRIGQTIGACRLTFQFGDDGRAWYRAPYRLPPGDRA
jgi:hypothetical protein